MHRPLFSVAAVLLFAAVIGCKNPFAPALDDSVGGASTVAGDQHTVDGFFQRFSFAYATRDSSVYGQLLPDGFTFVFRDYDNNVDQSWGRDVEMRTTQGLFQNAQNLSLTWNNIIQQSGDSVSLNVTRSFNLTITFNPQDIVFISGQADVQLKRAQESDVWMLARWRDNSSF